MNARNARAACSVFVGTVILATGIFLFVVLLRYQGLGPDAPCAGSWGPVTYQHRGNLTLAEENTFDAVVAGSVSNGENPEIDVSTVKDGEAVLFHDKSMLRVTGKDKDIAEVSIAEALSTPILEKIDGYNYTFANSIPRLEAVVEAICDADPSIGINFDTKSKDAVAAEVTALRDSACAGTADNVIWSTPLPGVVAEARAELERRGMDNRIAVYMPSGKYSFLGLKFMMKTRALQGLLAPGSSIVAFHKTVHDAEKDLIRSWVDDGWCTGIWGILPEEVGDYSADYYVVDVAPVFPDLPLGGLGSDGPPKETVYEDDSLVSYRVLLFVASLCLFCGIGLLIYTVGHTYKLRQEVLKETKSNGDVNPE